MIHNFSLIVLLFFVSCSYALAEQKEIEIVTEIDWSATENVQYQKGSLVTQISTLVLEKMGYKVNLSFVPWARALRNTEVGVADGVSGIFITEERAQLLTFTDSLVNTELLLFKRRESDIAYSGTLADLKQYKIGLVRNYTYGKAFDNASYLDKVFSAQSTNNLRMLLAKRVDVIIETNRTVNFLMKEQFSKRVDEIVPLKPAFKTQDVYFAFSKKLENHQALAKQFNQALAELRKDGTIAKLENEFASKASSE